jgi:hypothetical protein
MRTGPGDESRAGQLLDWEVEMKPNKSARSIDWDRYGSDRWSPEEVGDEIAGTILNVREETGKSGLLPVLRINTTHGEREVWAGQVQLQQSLAKYKPDVGDHITIKLVELRATGMPSPAKIFDIALDRAGGESPSGGDFDDESF